jgi:hypothetical protein
MIFKNAMCDFSFRETPKKIGETLVQSAPPAGIERLVIGLRGDDPAVNKKGLG